MLTMDFSNPRSYLSDNADFWHNLDEKGFLNLENAMEGWKGIKLHAKGRISPLNNHVSYVTKPQTCNQPHIDPYAAKHVSPQLPTSM